MPVFDVQGGLAIMLARIVSVAALLSLFGGLTFRAFVVPRLPDEAATAPIRGRLHRLIQSSGAIGILALLAWLCAQTADMAGAVSGTQAADALPDVLLHTVFGHVLGLQIAATLAALLVVGQGRSRACRAIALACASMALLLQAGHGHAWAMDHGVNALLICDLIHLLGAGAWLGGLLPLLIVVRDAAPRTGALAARWFSPLGKLCILALAVSALFQGWVLIGSIPGLVGTAYGWMALVKLALLAVLMAFAAGNRYRFAPALLRDAPEAARRVLTRSILVQSFFGLATVGAAAVLSSLPPAMHVQPVWPFPDRFTLMTIGEDPSFRNEVLGASLALGAAVLLLIVAAVLRRRASWLAVAAAAVIAWFAVPHLDLLFVPAYPTSFYHSPTRFTAASITQGAALFAGNCTMCHGPEGRGDGPAAKTLPVPPANLTAAHLWMHSDGELFWWLTHGIEAPDGGPAMPGFAPRLSPDDRWHLIDYIRAHNAGYNRHAAGHWTHEPLQAPDMPLRCTGGTIRNLADLHGQVVRLVFGAPPPGTDPAVTTIVAAGDPGLQPRPGLCLADAAAVPQAYAIVAGLPQDAMAGTQFLIDGHGWLRALQPAGDRPGWDDPKTLAAAIRHLQATPPAATAPMMCHAPMQM